MSTIIDHNQARHMNQWTVLLCSLMNRPVVIEEEQPAKKGACRTLAAAIANELGRQHKEKVFECIHEAGKKGISTPKLAEASGLCRQTVIVHARDLEREGRILIITKGCAFYFVSTESPHSPGGKELK